MHLLKIIGHTLTMEGGHDSMKVDKLLFVVFISLTYQGLNADVDIFGEDIEVRRSGCRKYFCCCLSTSRDELAEHYYNQGIKFKNLGQWKNEISALTIAAASGSEDAKRELERSSHDQQDSSSENSLAWVATVKDHPKTVKALYGVLIEFINGQELSPPPSLASVLSMVNNLFWIR